MVGATALNVAGGMSGFVCALAPDLALAGFVAQEDAIEEALGKLVGAGFQPDGLLEELGKRWEITRNYYRLYACCNPVHSALDALSEVLDALRPRTEDIERIEVATYRFASLMRNPEPPNFFASKYSLPHAAATLVVRGSAGYAALDDSSLGDPVIAALRPRVHISEDPAMTALAPRLRPARVSVVLKDGRRETRERQSHRGDFNEPFEEAEVRAKFRELAGVALKPEGVTAVERSVDRVEEWSSSKELTDLMRRFGRH
jgi:2-methylcitrate dehydratase PrpD